MTLIRAACAATLIGSLGGCAASGEFPSLARRPVEGIMNAPVAPAPASPAPNADPALAARVAEQLRRAEAGDRAFRDLRHNADLAVAAAAGAARGGERWLAAQQQLSRLEQARVAVATALAELDAMRLAQAIAVADGKPIAEAEALASAFERVALLDGEERAAVARLNAALGG